MGTTLPIQAITRDVQCQPRAYLTPNVINEYAEETVSYTHLTLPTNREV